MIGDEIEVSILSIGPTSVRVGIEAPRTVRVLRKEVYLERAADDGWSDGGPEGE